MNWWKRWKSPTCQHLSPKNSVWRWSCLKLSCLTFYIILQWYKVAHYIVHLFSWFRTWPRSSRSQGLVLALDKPLQEESEARSLHSRWYTIPTCTLSMLRIHKNSWFGSSLNGSKSSPATWSDSQSYIVLQSHHWTQVIQDDSRGQQEKEISRKQSEKTIQVENASIHFFSALALASFRMKAFSGGFITVWWRPHMNTILWLMRHNTISRITSYQQIYNL